MSNNTYVIPLNKITLKNLPQVGGKNASLGEMISNLSAVGVDVPPGFATTAEAFWEFIENNDLATLINNELSNLNVDNVSALVKAGNSIRNAIEKAELPQKLVEDITDFYNKLAADNPNASFAVRSSATAEDLPEASFAGQQETFLNVTGLDEIISKVKLVFASLFNDRAIAYRVHHGFSHKQVALSAGVQVMVRSDKGSSGVMFSIDTESGYDQVVFITSAYGLGELVVQGAVNPDEFYVYKQSLNNNKSAILRRNLGSKLQKMIYSDSDNVKTINTDVKEAAQFSLTDVEVEKLASIAVTIEKHYKRPMDIEWAKDGINGKLYIVQARPETVKSNADNRKIERYSLKTKGKIITEGRSIGQRIGQGKARIIHDLSEMDLMQPGEVLVTTMTDPDWEPIMKRAAAIVTDKGGRTCHAAIIARELGIPAVVGCGDASKTIKDGTEITVSCAEGDTGFVYQGLQQFELKTIDLESMPKLPFKIMMNVGNPDRAFSFQALPNAGIGLARLEFIISSMIGVHPQACLEFDKLPTETRGQIAAKISGYDSAVDYYIKKLAEGIATLGAAFAPQPVIVRLSDFKSNEYANLLGGDRYEPHEENPMLGFRGASRYIHPSFEACFELECKAVKYVRETMGIDNIQIMIPFVRTLEEAKATHKVLEKYGLKRGSNGLKVIMMCELPSNALLADEFLEYFDGFSIGSNDLTQLTLGLDRDSGIVANLFDERDAAVKKLLSMAIKACNKADKYIGICGQGPSDHPDLAKWLMQEGIDSVSLNPDSVLETWMYLADIKV